MARHALPALIAGSVLAALAACSDPSTAPNAPDRSIAPTGPVADLSIPDQLPDPSIRHVFPVHGPHTQGSLYVGQVIPGRIYYHNGPVLQAATTVVAVYWAASTIYTGGPAPGTTGAGTSDGSLMGLFLRSLGGSAYFNINTSYYDRSGNHIKNVLNYNGFWANNSYNVPSGTQNVSDAQMLDMLQYGFNNGKLSYNGSTLYLIFTAGAVNLGGGFGSQYCAYHTHGTVKVGGVSQNVLYAAMPYNAASSGCIAQSQGPNYAADPGIDPEVSVVAHETEETTTDEMANAWYDLFGYENADKCAWTWGPTQTASNGAAYNLTLGGKNWLVQRNWIATNGGCAMSY